jgi:hypothetical protein
MHEKTETKPLQEITESLKEIMESLKKITESLEKTTGPVEEITDYYAKKWYKEGFRFAINYIYVSILKSGDTRVDPKLFREYLDDLLDIGIEDDYFVKHPFNNGNYPSGQCPGDSPGTCIQCADEGIRPIDTIPPSKR